MSSSQSFLRQRNAAKTTEKSDRKDSSSPKRREEVVWGKTPGGEVFRVPTTHDVLTALFHPAYPKSHLDILNLALLGFQLVLFFALPRGAARVFFLVYFAFWRTAYDAGLGWVLTKQSKKKWMVKEVQRLGWLDENRCPQVRNWIRAQLVGKMGKDYSFDELPLEYNAWLLFRQAVDVILINDFLAYCMFAFSCFRVPTDLSIPVHVMRCLPVTLESLLYWIPLRWAEVKCYRWPYYTSKAALVHMLKLKSEASKYSKHSSVGFLYFAQQANAFTRWLVGITLIWFNLWVKTEAHNVVKDYGWYWGDVFFQRGALVFDGVFELAPHPMYSVGYIGYYGLSLIVGSYPVLFVSLAAHASQFAFLVFFENPHIERMYGQKKAIAKRIPVNTRSNMASSSKLVSAESASLPQVPPEDCPTPAATEGETATETDLETETEMEYDESTPVVGFKSIKRSLHRTELSTESASSAHSHEGLPKKRKALSNHDLLTKYFRRDTMIFKNFDLFRANDVMLLLIVLYSSGFALIPPLSARVTIALHFVHALGWCLFHCFGLGLLLRAQSERKYLVRHYMKNYHYPHHDGGSGPILEAFSNWKAVYNMSQCMTYVSLIGLVWKTYNLPTDWMVGNELLRHTLGALLVALHIWASLESYEVLGMFGWFFGDFFMEEFPAHVEYSGIYRYLNNPELMGGAAWFGLGLISESKLVITLAVIRHLSYWWFLSCVENPHMQKLYGDSLRKDAGFVKVIKSVASKNARILESRAGRHAPELKRVAKEVKGTFDKVFEETADAVEEFLAKSRPKISGVVQDTKVLLQQSREKLVITRVASDLSSFDTAKYHATVVPSKEGTRSFHLGEPITVQWQAPHTHSRKDWIGIYRVGANKSQLVTKTSSLGMWEPVYGTEWDGDVPLDSPPGPQSDSGTVTFKANTLPWLVGQYEIRYHHDGKYNVMSLDGPIEIYVDRPSTLDLPSVRETLMRVVPLCLDSDPSLIPLSYKSTLNRDGTASPNEADERDPDDFTFWSERQAKRISMAIKQTFDVEYAPEVVVADANLTALANRILVSKEILTG